MKKSISATMIVLLVLCVFSLTHTSAKASEIASKNSLFDHFDGNRVNDMKWTVQENTNMSGLPAFGGSVTVADSQVTLASTGDGTSFPCITSAFNPCPASGDFVVEFDLTYDCISDWGTGLWISRGTFGNSSADTVLQVWADNEASWTRTAIRVYLLGSQVYRSEVYGWEPSADTQTFKLEYIKGVYTLFVDSVKVATESSAIRPDTVGFGHPPSKGIPVAHERAIGNVGRWSSFKIDFIKVSPPVVISISTSTAQTELGFGVDISGTLCSQEGTPLIGETVILSYRVPAVGEWNPFTSAVTNQDGSYIATWLPTATGAFMVKAEWAGIEAFSEDISVVGSNSFFTQTTASLGLVSLWVILAVVISGYLVYFKKHHRVRNHENSKQQ